MTQTEIARIMGVSQNRVSKMENGDIAVMSIESVRPVYRSDRRNGVAWPIRPTGGSSLRRRGASSKGRSCIAGPALRRAKTGLVAFVGRLILRYNGRV